MSKSSFFRTAGQLFLHEDQIPDLQEAILVHHRPTVRAILGAAVHVDLAARPTGSRDAHVPVVVEHAAPLNPLRWQAGDAFPERRGLVVRVEDGDPDLAGVKPVSAAGL